MSVTNIISLFGGLGMFLFGMKLMSDGLEQVAGARMRSILEFFTQNRFIGMIVGLVFTGIIQSSNATTVMVVSFVNSGLMQLHQATGPILGANIGTTVTGQLIAFNLAEIAPLFVIIGAVMYMFFENQNVKKIGIVLLGFGILFMGLSTMGEKMTGLQDSPQIVHLLQSMQNPLVAILLGFVVTAVLQSASASVGIIILMAAQGLLAFEICFFLILGCNMGCCISALLVSLNGNKDAKRAAWIHLLFNIIGSLIVFVMLMVALGPICSLFMRISGNDVGRAVANANTLIKVFEVGLLFPFMGWIVKFTYVLIPGEDAVQEEAHRPKYINKSISAATAVIDAIHEMQYMGELAKENLQKSMEALCSPDQEKIEAVYEQEKYIDYLNQEITAYLVQINGLDIPMADGKMVGGLFHVVNDIERIGDHAENFADFAKRRAEKQIPFSDKALKQMQEMTEMVLRQLDYALNMFSSQSLEHMREILRLEDAVDEKEKRLRKAHVKRLTKGKCTPEAGVLYSDVISGLERVGDHATNIAFALRPENQDELEELEEEDD
ncbi:MAG: Na/Pi cotransporter family protein [Ruminococcus sp.]|uniref:Na/Pi cotransporter family protein n=1 Tax=Schaedlerella arabinosiphila TaxID=2044587 RepID=A0A426DGI9_9FIRM|nr:Na/Pi cotransporter family protein [Schaedlerella arabinosiphila]MCI8723290.1 Na/Pi cotransporter family protein [Ruminococcus sp.]RRK31821.1 Na/Pi cotransporter family protein [Schaedlerella arabinosiphila]